MPVLSFCSDMPQPSSVIEMAKLVEQEEESSMAIRSWLAPASLELSVRSPKAERGMWCACALASKKEAPVLKEGTSASSSSIFTAPLQSLALRLYSEDGCAVTAPLQIRVPVPKPAQNLSNLGGGIARSAHWSGTDCSLHVHHFTTIQTFCRTSERNQLEQAGRPPRLLHSSGTPRANIPPASPAASQPPRAGRAAVGCAVLMARAAAARGDWRGRR